MLLRAFKDALTRVLPKPPQTRRAHHFAGPHPFQQSHQGFHQRSKSSFDYQYDSPLFRFLQAEHQGLHTNWSSSGPYFSSLERQFMQKLNARKASNKHKRCCLGIKAIKHLFRGMFIPTCTDRTDTAPLQAPTLDLRGYLVSLCDGLPKCFGFPEVRSYCCCVLRVVNLVAGNKRVARNLFLYHRTFCPHTGKVRKSASLS